MEEKIIISKEEKERISRIVNRYMRMRLKRNLKKVFKILIPIR